MCSYLCSRKPFSFLWENCSTKILSLSFPRDLKIWFVGVCTWLEHALIYFRMLKLALRQTCAMKGVAICNWCGYLQKWCGYLLLVWLFAKMVWLFQTAFLGLLVGAKNVENKNVSQIWYTYLNSCNNQACTRTRIGSNVIKTV